MSRPGTPRRQSAVAGTDCSEPVTIEMTSGAGQQPQNLAHDRLRRTAEGDVAIGRNQRFDLVQGAGRKGPLSRCRETPR